MYKYYQPNSKDIKDEYGDCVIRAFTKALDKDWLTVFDELVPYSRTYQCPYNSKPCMEKYLQDRGFSWTGISVKAGKSRPTVASFSKEHKHGTYILRVAHHVVACIDGVYYDTWDSGYKSVYGYWEVA